ncbi:MAG: sigma-54-dependent Fis family transcriptional regulator [Planctomycetes bacterium]|nr:sigma-54-dependent Fis family transcriptional regulator [Planctomycetota bacterium]
MKRRVLVADDEGRMVRNIECVLGDVAGVELVRADDKWSILDCIDSEKVHLVITDLRVSEMGRLEFLKHIKAKDPELPVIIITGDDSVELAVQAMKEGAFDYISRPFEGGVLVTAVRKAIKIRSLMIENRYLRHELESHYNFGNIISNSPKMLEVLLLAGDVSRTDTTVTIFGESGTGKELVAKAIHFNSLRKGGPLIVINCAALPENLLESELFGYEKGAFTGAEKCKKGRFEMANGGTLFLDEISEMNPVIQAKVLRVVEERELERLGGSETLKVDVRIICASNKDLGQLVKKGAFREDLFYRINVFPIQIPPLRERSEDILFLVNAFVERYSVRMGKCSMRVSKDAEQLLISDLWEGNIRELKNCIERAVILCKGNLITRDHLPLSLVKNSPINHKFEDKEKKGGIVDFEIPPEGICLEEVEKQIVLQALKKSNNNKTKAAKLLGLTRGTLRYRLEKFTSN